MELDIARDVVVDASRQPMSAIMMRAELEAFFAEPSAALYLRLRRRVRRYRRKPAADQLARLECLFQQGEFPRVRDEANRLLPHWMLSPRLYRLDGLAAWELGDAEAAAIGRFLHEACLRGILATGNGEPGSAYEITYDSDIDEVLEHIGVVADRRRLVRGPGGLCDVADACDGREVWFVCANAPSDALSIDSSLVCRQTPPCRYSSSATIANDKSKSVRGSRAAKSRARIASGP